MSKFQGTPGLMTFEDGGSESEMPINRKRISGGSFNTMNLMPSLLKNIQKLGYKQPTPIQRKTIPPLLLGKDVVGMARTGSGKTAAFGIPLVQKLREHCGITGVRGLIISPTRELAIQTAGVMKGLSKGSSLKIAQVVGGETLEEQFASLATNPDILVATPGRLLHLSAETKFSLKRVQMVVFDEADRLFEMGFSEQLSTLLTLIPLDSRQTILFSATLPRTLAEFAGAGLRPDAVFVRLDSESKISPDLSLSWHLVKSNCRCAALMTLLKSIYPETSITKLTLVFTATKHHVEYLVELLRTMNMQCGGVYGSMDQEAREQAIHNFRSHKWPILVVTDLAARGLDIPYLDNVINFDFTSSPKLFIHRVGRAARAGRTGTAYSLMSSDEVPYFVEVAIFLSKDPQGMLTSIPQDLLDFQNESIKQKHSLTPNLQILERVMMNAVKHYHSSRPSATSDSHTTAKLIVSKLIPMDKKFASSASDFAETESLRAAIHNYKPKTLMKIATSKSKAEKPINTRSGKNEDFDEYYMSYHPKTTQQHEDRAYAIKSDLLSASMDMSLKDDGGRTKQKRCNGTIKLENGAALPASFNTDKYELWKKKMHVAIPKLGEQELPESTQSAVNVRKKRWVSKKKFGKNAKKSKN